MVVRIHNPRTRPASMSRPATVVLLSALALLACEGVVTPPVVPEPLTLEARAYSPALGLAETNDYCLLTAVLPLYEMPAEWSGAVTVEIARARRTDGQLRTVAERVEQAVPVQIRSMPDSTFVVIGGVVADSLSGRTAVNQAEGQWTCPPSFPGGGPGETLPKGSWRLGVILPD